VALQLRRAMEAQDQAKIMTLKKVLATFGLLGLENVYTREIAMCQMNHVQ
jgi:hypothetical protein